MFDAILFDLDGTLINNNMRTFVDEYFSTLGPRIEQYCPDGDYVSAVLEANKPMFRSKKSRAALQTLFLREFKNITGLDEKKVKKIFYDYYENEYKNINVVKPVKYALECLHAAAKITDNIVVATVPIFPVVAIRQRLIWGNITNYNFKLITGCDVMHSSKPYPEYYLEITKKLKCDPEKCLMIGNDHIDDLSAKAVGMQTFLVKKHQVNRGRGVYKADHSGNMKALIRFLKKAKARI